MSHPAHRNRAVTARSIHFGPFEADLRSGELRKRGIKVRLGQQSFDILRMLVEHAGEVVLREDIRLKLWPQDTAVAFDHSINAAIQKLRDALGESAGNPRFIETLPRRGYRFIGTVELPAVWPAIEAASPASAEPVREKADLIDPIPTRNTIRGPLPMNAVAAVALLALLAVTGWRSWMAQTPARSWIFPLGDLHDPVVSPDGSAVLYREPNRGLLLRRMDAVRETLLYQGGLQDAPAWSPDGSQVIFRASPGLYSLTLPSGPLTLIGPQMGITRGMNWGPGGTILVGMAPDDDLNIVRADGRDPPASKFPVSPAGHFSIPSSCPMERTFCSRGRPIRKSMKLQFTWRPLKTER